MRRGAEFDRGYHWILKTPTRNYTSRTKFDTIINAMQKYYLEIIYGLFVFCITPFNEIDILTQNM